MGVTTDLTTNWDLVNATQQVIPAEDRDFSRPREPYFAASYPKDVAQADDTVVNKVTELVPSASISEFQNFLSKSQPVIGLLYTGPVDGLVNSALIQAAKNVEDKIAKEINDPGVHGLLWNDASKSFNTSTTDLSQTLKLLTDRTIGAKSSVASRQERLNFFKKLYSTM